MLEYSTKKVYIGARALVDVSAQILSTNTATKQFISLRASPVLGSRCLFPINYAHPRPTVIYDFRP